MAAIAKAAGKDCLVGSMLEMRPGTIFAGHFAISKANVTYASEIVGSLILTDDILTEPVVINDGALHLPGLAGLGIELDGLKMKTYSR